MVRRKKRKDTEGAEELDRDEGASQEGSADRDTDESCDNDEPTATAEIEKLAQERQALEDKLKRALADMANIRRRQGEEVRRASENAIGRLAQELLPIMDSFQLALNAEGDRTSLLDGVRMVHSMLEDLMGRHGVEPISAMGETFDPQQHEALQMQERDDVPANTVIAVHQSGFRLGTRILRPARVVLSQQPSGQQPTEQHSTEDESPEEPSQPNSGDERTANEED